MSDSPVCWQCGASLAELTPPFSRFDVCRQCRAELHVCRQCRFHDVTVANQCREPVAEPVHDKQRANTCDYFVLRADAWQSASNVGQQARAGLDALFGQPDVVEVKSAADPLAALNDLFVRKS